MRVRNRFNREAVCSVSLLRNLLCLACCALIVGCGRSKGPSIEDLVSHEDLSIFKLGALRGTRDGDRLDAQAMFTDSSSMLTIDLRFLIGSPTQLQSGAWRWTRNNRSTNGGVSARSVMFLGGQSGPPSIGGVFDLRDQNGTALYRVSIPVTELKTRLEVLPDWLRSHPATHEHSP